MLRDVTPRSGCGTKAQSSAHTNSPIAIKRRDKEKQRKKEQTSAEWMPKWNLAQKKDERVGTDTCCHGNKFVGSSFRLQVRLTDRQNDIAWSFGASKLITRFLRSDLLSSLLQGKVQNFKTGKKKQCLKERNLLPTLAFTFILCSWILCRLPLKRDGKDDYLLLLLEQLFRIENFNRRTSESESDRHATWRRKERSYFGYVMWSQMFVVGWCRSDRKTDQYINIFWGLLE